MTKSRGLKNWESGNQNNIFKKYQQQTIINLESMKDFKIPLPTFPPEFTKLLVTGHNTFNDYDFLKEELDKLTRRMQRVVIITGTTFSKDQKGNRIGTDILADRWADTSKISKRSCHFYPDFESQGKHAAIQECQMEMVKFSEKAVIFWDGRCVETRQIINLVKQFMQPNCYRIYKNKEKI